MRRRRRRGLRTQERRRGEQPRLGRRSDAVARFDLFYLRSRDRVSSPAGPLFSDNSPPPPLIPAEGGQIVPNQPWDASVTTVFVETESCQRQRH